METDLSVSRLIPKAAPDHENVLSSRRSALATELGGVFAAQDLKLTWEVGCGHGHFLNAYAAAHPEEVCVGVDIASDRVERAVRKRDRAKLANLHFVRADARLFLEVLPAGARFHRVFVLFPDPWPKSRHHKHRVMQAEFLTWVARRMPSEGRLYFRTDHADYLDETRHLLHAHPHWELVDEPWPFEFETVFQSRADTFGSLISRPKPLS